MTSETLKSAKPTFWANLQYVGLAVEDVPVINQKLYPSGKATLQIDGSPYTGQAELYVSCGGLLMRSATEKVKEIFKQDVMPVLVESFPEVNQKFTGKIVLHFRDGELTTFSMTP